MVALLPAYEDCSVSGGIGTNKPLVAFAKFTDASSASNALRMLDRHVFDEEFPGRGIQVEMARRDLEIRPRSARPPSRQMPPPYMDHVPHGHNGMHMPPPHYYGGPPHHSAFHEPGPMYGGPTSHYYPGPGDGRAPKRSRFEVGADTTSGDTICFIKLPRDATEGMVHDLVKHLSGYTTMNFVSGSGSGPMAFALFKDGHLAKDAINALQGRTICDTPVQVQIARRSMRIDGPTGSSGGAGGNQDDAPKTCRRMENERFA